MEIHFMCHPHPVLSWSPAFSTTLTIISSAPFIPLLHSLFYFSLCALSPFCSFCKYFICSSARFHIVTCHLALAKWSRPHFHFCRKARDPMEGCNLDGMWKGVDDRSWYLNVLPVFCLPDAVKAHFRLGSPLMVDVCTSWWWDGDHDGCVCMCVCGSECAWKKKNKKRHRDVRWVGLRLCDNKNVLSQTDSDRQHVCCCVHDLSSMLCLLSVYIKLTHYTFHVCFYICHLTLLYKHRHLKKRGWEISVKV